MLPTAWYPTEKRKPYRDLSLASRVWIQPKALKHYLARYYLPLQSRQYLLVASTMRSGARNDYKMVSVSAAHTRRSWLLI